MEVILKEDVKGVGRSGEVVKVSEGYFRNFLQPHNKAVEATEKALKAHAEEAKRRAEKKGQEDKALRELAAKMGGISVTIKRKASEDNKLFGSVAEADVAEALTAAGYKADKHCVIMEKHIKETGDFPVVVRFKQDIEAKIRVKVEKEEQKKGR